MFQGRSHSMRRRYFFEREYEHGPAAVLLCANAYLVCTLCGSHEAEPNLGHSAISTRQGFAGCDFELRQFVGREPLFQRPEKRGAEDAVRRLDAQKLQQGLIHVGQGAVFLDSHTIAQRVDKTPERAVRELSKSRSHRWLETVGLSPSSVPQALLGEFLLPPSQCERGLRVGKAAQRDS